MTDTTPLAELRAAARLLLDSNSFGTTVRGALQDLIDSIDDQWADALNARQLGTAFCTKSSGRYCNGQHSHGQIGLDIRAAVEATGARIVTGDEQPEDVAQLRAERDRYRDWIQDVARLGTHYDPNPTTTGSPEKRIGLLADYIRCMDTAMRETARRVLEDEGAVTGAEQSLPLGDLIGFGNAERPNPESTAWISQPYHFPTEEAARNALNLGERATAVFLLPEARVR